MAFLDDIEARLIAQGVVSTGWTLRKAYHADAPDQLIIISEIPAATGFPPDYFATANEQLMFQVRVRAARLDYTAGRLKSQGCFNALHGASLTGPPFYVYIMALADGPRPFYDPEDRPNFTQEYKVLKVRG